MKEYRIIFEKTGAMVYSSHLDLVRYFTRAMNRASIPVRFTEGFTKKPRLRFSPPLSLGAHSFSELLDVQIEDDMMSAMELKHRLNAVMSSGCHIRKVVEAAGKLSDLTDASWQLLFPFGAEEATARLDALNRSELIVTKRTKSGEKPLNILPLLKERSLTERGARACLDITMDINLNPRYILQGCGIDEDGVDVTRTGFFFADGSAPF